MFSKALITLGFLVLNASVGTSQPEARTNPPAPPNDSAYWAWLSEPWTGSDKPYIRTRNAIDSALAKGQDPNALLGKYKVLSQSKPRDPQAQFAWGYAAFRASRAETRNFNESQRKLAGVSNALAVPLSPRSYQYARLRFLTMVESYILDNRLRKVGERLARRNPKDWDVKHGLIRVLVYTTRLETTEKRQALAYAQELLRLDPKRPKGYADLGTIYYASWMASNNKLDADKAVSAYKRYIRLVPPDDDSRQLAERIIKRIQETQAKKRA